MVAIELPQFGRPLVVAQVVVALGEAETTLADVEQVAVRVVEIRRYIHAVEDRHSVGVQMRGEIAEVAGIRDGGNTFDIGCKRTGAGICNGLDGHARAEVRTGDCVRFRVSSCGEKSVEKLLVAHLDLVERSP